MAGTIAQSPFLQAVSAVENSELNGGSSRKSWIANNVNLRGRASASSSSTSRHSPQTLIGSRRTSSVDALTSRSGKVLHANACTFATGKSSSRVSVVAEYGENSTKLTIGTAQEEAGSSNGLENARKPNSPADGDVRSDNFNSATDSYRPGARRSAESATSSSFRAGPIPSSVAGKHKGKNVYVDRWMPPGSKLHHVKLVLERLQGVQPTDEAVKEAMDGWDTIISSRDINNVISNLNWKTAQAFFNWLQSQDYNLSIVAYNVLMGRYRAGKVWRNAEDFAHQMIRDGIQPDNYTYSTMISCALQCNFPKEALKWFDKMHADGVVPDEVTYSNMALVYSRLGMYEDAVELYERLRQTGWKPDKISFGTMVNVYARGGDYFKASAVIREMQGAGLQPEAVVYNTLIRYFSREGKTGQAKRVFQDMEKSGVKPTEYTLSLMIDNHGRAGETKEAFELFTRMKEEKLPLDVVVYNSLLKMCAEERLVAEAESLVAGMVGRGLKPDSITYKSMINLYSREGMIKEAEKFANRMVEVGFDRDVVVYSCLMKACGVLKDFKGAASYVDQMLADGCEVDDRCCGTLLSLMNSCETKEDRTVIVDCLRKAKPVLSEMTDVLLADNLDLDALEELVRRLLSESEADSHRPFCNAFVDVCWSLDMKDRASKVLLLADSLGVYPGGLRTSTSMAWFLHLRSLSFNAAECGLLAWLQYLTEKLEEGEEFPQGLIIETGTGRSRGDVIRLFNVILSKLEELGAPFEPSPDRTDLIISTGSAVKEWLTSYSSRQSTPAAEETVEQ
ncbi:unnamed protein product [Calypogeia fissa]